MTFILVISVRLAHRDVDVRYTGRARSGPFLRVALDPVCLAHFPGHLIEVQKLQTVSFLDTPMAVANGILLRHRHSALVIRQSAFGSARVHPALFWCRGGAHPTFDRRYVCK
ncbi:MAG: hypothetical protein ABI680_14255 [Chthoniobacteraceae bacterium]